MNWKFVILILVVIGLAVAFAGPTSHFLLVVTGSINESHAWYGFWSGFAGDLGIFGGVAIWYKKHNCHDHYCWRLGKHQMANGQFTVCTHHFKQVTGLHKKHKITIHHIKQAHDATLDG